MAREAYSTSLEQSGRCLTCREIVPAGTRCTCVDVTRADGSHLMSCICAACTSAVATAQLGE